MEIHKAILPIFKHLTTLSLICILNTGEPLFVHIETEAKMPILQPSKKTVRFADVVFFMLIVILYPILSVIWATEKDDDTPKFVIYGVVGTLSIAGMITGNIISNRVSMRMSASITAISGILYLIFGILQSRLIAKKKGLPIPPISALFF